MINTKLNINEAFIEQVHRCMNNAFGPSNQHFLRATLAKNKAILLALLMFYETRKNPKKYSKVLSCVIYTIISNYVCMDYLACEWEKLSELTVGTGGVFKHRNKSYDKILGIGIPYLLINLISYHSFLKNKNYVVMLKYPKRMLEYYLSKGSTIFECNTNNLANLPNEIKYRIHA